MNGLQLANTLQIKNGCHIPGPQSGDQAFKSIGPGSIGIFIHMEFHPKGQGSMVMVICFLQQYIDQKCVEHGYNKIKGSVIVRHFQK